MINALTNTLLADFKPVMLVSVYKSEERNYYLESHDINDKGEVIGVTTMKLSGRGVEGIGFCIPSKTVLEMLNIKF